MIVQARIHPGDRVRADRDSATDLVIGPEIAGTATTASMRRDRGAEAAGRPVPHLHLANRKAAWCRFTVAEPLSGHGLTPALRTGTAAAQTISRGSETNGYYVPRSHRRDHAEPFADTTELTVRIAELAPATVNARQRVRFCAPTTVVGQNRPVASWPPKRASWRTATRHGRWAG
jgi:hypothetical protein